MLFANCDDFFELPEGEKIPSSAMIEMQYQDVQKVLANIDKAIKVLEDRKVQYRGYEKYLYNLFPAAAALEGTERKIEGYAKR